MHSLEYCLTTSIIGTLCSTAFGTLPTFCHCWSYSENRTESLLQDSTQVGSWNFNMKTIWPTAHLSLGRRWYYTHRQNLVCQGQGNSYLTFTLAYVRDEEVQLGQLKWKAEKRRWEFRGPSNSIYSGHAFESEDRCIWEISVTSWWN